MPDLPALVAVAHGSRDPRAARTVTDLLARVQRRVPESPVHAAYLDFTAPGPETKLRELARLGVREVVVLPLLLTVGYHSRVDIPAAVAAVQADIPDLAVHYGQTLGPDPLLLAGLERRLRAQGVVPGGPGTAVVLAAAGSSDSDAVATIEASAREWRRRGWGDVRPAYASAARPTIGEAVAAMRAQGARRVAVAPYFLAPGLLPDRARSAGADIVAGVLGTAPEVVEVVLARWRAAAGALAVS